MNRYILSVYTLQIALASEVVSTDNWQLTLVLSKCTRPHDGIYCPFRCILSLVQPRVGIFVIAPYPTIINLCPTIRNSQFIQAKVWYATHKHTTIVKWVPLMLNCLFTQESGTLCDPLFRKSLRKSHHTSCRHM